MKTRYVVKMNLAGLHRKIYVCKSMKKRMPGYWTKDGRVNCTDKSYYADGIVQLVYKNKKEAIAAMEGAQMVADFIVKRLK